MDRLLVESESGHDIERQRDREERQRDRNIQHSWSYSQLSLKLRSNFVASKVSTPVVFLSHPSSLCQSDSLLEAISVFLIFLSLPHSSSFCWSYRLLGTSTFTQFQSCQSCEKCHQSYVSPPTVAQLRPQQPPKTPPANKIISIK